MRLAFPIMAGIGLAFIITPARADVLLSGPDSNAGSYSTAALQSLAGGSTVNSGGVTGIALWALLNGSTSSTSVTNADNSNTTTYGGITTNTPAGDNSKNAILRYYLVGTNASGAQSVVSLGEIDPFFGGTASPGAFVAFQNTGSGLLAEPELVVPNQPGRDLTDLTSLQLEAVPALTLPPNADNPSVPSTAVALSGNVANPGSYTLSMLQALPSAQLSAGGETYTGVPLWTFLDPTSSDAASQIVVTQATDGYEVVLALGELDTTDGAAACALTGVNTSCDLLPYASTGTDFTTGLDGVARTVFPTDNHHGRWGSDLDGIEVLDSSQDMPEPATLSLLAVGLASLAGIRKRRGSPGPTRPA
jgi:hypothetical protein